MCHDGAVRLLRRMAEGRPTVAVPILAGGLSLLSWVGLLGLAGYGVAATAARVACETRTPGVSCAADWDRAMGRAGAGFLLLFAHSPGEGGARALVQRLTGRRRDESPMVALAEQLLSTAPPPPPPPPPPPEPEPEPSPADPREVFLPPIGKWDAETLPPGWRRDDAGHLRDDQGRYASEQAAEAFWRER